MRIVRLSMRTLPAVRLGMAIAAGLLLSACQTSSIPQFGGFASQTTTPTARPDLQLAQTGDPTTGDQTVLAAHSNTADDPKPVQAADNAVAKPQAELPLRKVVKAVTRPVVEPVKKVAMLARRPNFFERARLRREKYRPLVARVARKEGVPVDLAMAIIQIESSFRPRATGALGEIGLMQVRPRTARGLGYRGTKGDLYVPETNVQVGMKYLAEARRRGGGTTCGTILKYNAGHYAKKMNPVSARYCKRVKKVMREQRNERQDRAQNPFEV